jgi:hypothetical protein
VTRDVEVEVAGSDRGRLEQVAKLRGAGQAANLVDDGDRLGDPVGEHERVTPHERDADDRVEIVGFERRRLEPFGCGLRLPGRELGRTEVAQHSCALAGGRGFCERATKVCRGHVHRTLARSAASRRTQMLHDRALSGRLGFQEVGGDGVAAAARIREDPSRAGMGLRAHARRNVQVDRRSHERVHEREPTFVAEDLRAHERLDERGGRFIVQPGKRSRVP